MGQLRQELHLADQLAATSRGTAGCSSAPIASTLLRQRCSGSPSSSRKPPFWPPVPQAHDRQALLWVRVCQSRAPEGRRPAELRLDRLPCSGVAGGCSGYAGRVVIGQHARWRIPRKP
ncbi:hypothetical protein [Synechococcus sp. CBW1002]|uniref:hypothetical protein n=1 Tax=Synechococcus sp. CBW1002 TaxID=1353134 RepID=UPI001E606375|nr:hypothetical protein [Synechococcus sp. CBW1002]